MKKIAVKRRRRGRNREEKEERKKKKEEKSRHVVEAVGCAAYVERQRKRKGREKRGKKSFLENILICFKPI